jgi:D-3-phosphoglycerate dehydrogenase / 2-oxoglutarate reductase
VTDPGTVAVTDHPFRDLDIERAILEEVALHTIALLLASHRRVAQGDRRVRGGAWGVLAAGPVRRLEGQLLGLIGCGRIPRSVAGKARGLGLRVAAHDPFVAEDGWPEGIERALDRALTEGWIGGAALDVLETEPPPPDLPLLRHEHLIVTAHQAFYSEEALRELQRKAAQNLLDALEATS